MQLLDYVKEECRDAALRKLPGDGARLTAAAYDRSNDAAIDIVDDVDTHVIATEVAAKERRAQMGWIFNVQNQLVRKANVGNLMACSVVGNWDASAISAESFVFLYTGHQEWIRLEQRTTFTLLLDDALTEVWMGSPCTLQDVLDETCFSDVMDTDRFPLPTSHCKTVLAFFARCENSMALLDDSHRSFFTTHPFDTPGEIVAITAVAGAGKTTAIITFAKAHSEKRILYTAFNKAIIEEVGKRVKEPKSGTKNMVCRTFDSLMLEILTNHVGTVGPLQYDGIKTSNLHAFVEIPSTFPHQERLEACAAFIAFCKDREYHDPNTFSVAKKGSICPTLSKIWDSFLANNFITFDAVKKRVCSEGWFSDLNDKYDLIIVDEAQDFNPIMLEMLLRHATTPKLFIGDPMQGIYGFTGAVDAFNRLPKSTLKVEFYSSYRIGNPACKHIRAMFKDYWIISKTDRVTNIVTSLEEADRPTYLFRTWRLLLKTAHDSPSKVWVHNFQSHANDLRKEFQKLTIARSEIARNNVPITEEQDKGIAIRLDDAGSTFPRYLLSFRNEEAFETFIDKTKKNTLRGADNKKPHWNLRTVHSFKGLETDCVRVAGDNNMDNKDNIHTFCVALTRCRTKLMIDKDDRLPV